MVDSAPLLPQNSDIDRNSVFKDCHKSSGKLLQAILIAFAWVFDGQQSFITIFTDAEPKWKCLDPTDLICKQASSPCGLQPGSWTWASPAGTSTVSEWVLQCANTVLLSLPSSSFFAGCLVGGLFLSTLADSVLGRKTLLFLSCLIMSLAGSMTVLSHNIWVYSALKFVSGFGRASVGTAALVLSMEIVDKRWREKIGVLGFAFYMLGFLTLPIMAYISQGFSWSLACVFEAVGAASKILLAAEVIAYCSACTAFNVLLIYSAEIFPTIIRNTAIGLVREAGLLAGVVAPILAAEGQNNRFWSFGFFGLVIMLCGLSCICLPETKGRELADHIEDEANN
ncbi:hypothetical protein LUZ61_019642 [Rhynchospora tenuis]|uniref:H(+)/Pi cotransporter n=1 Tax=Rhynchospora tenuis TaxID=198213 RepID=A0AAD5ZBJ9_9POAL|nr:hypothetical protein LUZ61_019642 [Rhynchospora tenuis]